MILFGAMLDAPLVGLLQRWPNRLHAVEMREIASGWERGTFVTACGIKGVRLYGLEVDGKKIAAPWPPRLRGLPDRFVRCKKCYDLTGKMRPRVEWGEKESAA